jgi:hypothetical protein
MATDKEPKVGSVGLVRAIVGCIWVLWLPACGGSSHAGATDAGTTDAGTTDAGTTDAGTMDGGTSFPTTTTQSGIVQLPAGVTVPVQ